MCRNIVDETGFRDLGPGFEAQLQRDGFMPEVDVFAVVDDHDNDDDGNGDDGETDEDGGEKMMVVVTMLVLLITSDLEVIPTVGAFFRFPQ
ncbi:hypothetical protein DPMN_022339 [Dreissena polymorpha]|uniref:Uncharacterized protein n=1 Tax=Dreissena polymorpha TaxID=45954 RepID=A0A9D4NP93_DREPO|nr:hypothetical protein DPMN_022339 [Dreissena polymorpha]